MPRQINPQRWQRALEGDRGRRQDLENMGEGDYRRDYTFSQAYPETERMPGREAPEAGEGRPGFYSRDDLDWTRPGPYTGVGPRGYQRSEERIREDAYDHLTRHGMIDASGVEVSVSGSVIILTGEVNTRREKRLAEQAVEGIFGVTDVENRLRIR